MKCSYIYWFFFTLLCPFDKHDYIFNNNIKQTFMYNWREKTLSNIREYAVINWEGQLVTGENSKTLSEGVCTGKETTDKG